MADTVLTYPDKFHLATAFADKRFGDLEANTEVETGAKLALYALRQQAEVGACNTSAPYMWNVTEKYKHSAWSHLGKMNKFEAMVKYVQILDQLVGEDWHMSPASSPVKGARPTTTAESVETSATTTQPPAQAAQASNVAADADLPTEVTADNFQLLRREVIKLRNELQSLKGSTPHSQAQTHSLHQWQRGSIVIPSATPPPPAIYIHYNPSGSVTTSGLESSTSVMLAPLPIPPAAVPPSSRYHADEQWLRAQQRQQQKLLGDPKDSADKVPVGSSNALHHRPPTAQPPHQQAAQPTTAIEGNPQHRRGASAVAVPPIVGRQRSWMEWLGLS